MQQSGRTSLLIRGYAPLQDAEQHSAETIALAAPRKVCARPITRPWVPLAAPRAGTGEPTLALCELL
jgi:hypothetical protein